MITELPHDGWSLYAEILPKESLRQGDLVEFRNTSDPLRQYGLVVTADCDLERRKHGRLITLVPVISIRTVIEYYLLLEQLDRQHDHLITYAKKCFGIAGDIKDPIVAAELRSLSDNKNSDPVWRLPCLAVKGILNDLDQVSVRDFCDLMCEISVNISKLPEKIANQIKDKGDLILLPHPTFLSAGVSIAWVRQIWQVPTRNIVFRNSEVMESLGVRIANLNSPYRYRVTQVMGQVFSDIGTPDIANDVSASIKGIFPQ